ncbi:DJ-1/PfpI family protein [Streptomyces triculaminicus]|uniref:DJ-1/PfpI family protein n=3 Tax=Streptomyces TaxID=1883 RepID=A0A939FKX5_9ACTN|nr:DJ-1/PfpI family protein [Streptomyces triculaminicus]QSY52661.1 DJ-1/PfpI family protein [Streptomyces griseocarneus]
MATVNGKVVTHDVVIVVYDGVQLLDVAGPLDVFDRAAAEGGAGYRVRLASLGGRPVVTSAEAQLGVSADLARIRKPPDTLMVAGGRGYAAAAADRELVRHVRRLAGGSRRTGSVCTGAFVLAAAGLLDGRRATTHWAFCSELAVCHPAVSVEPDAFFVRDGTVVTSAGVTAGIDLSLALLEDDFGPELARAVAKFLVVFMQRPGGQSQFSTWMRREPLRGALSELVDNIDSDPSGDRSVPALAALMGMSRRHFSRLFTQQVGTSPGAYVERARVAAARALLESSADGVDAIAGRCGFGTVETMRRAFVRETGVSPAAYRDRFRRG